MTNMRRVTFCMQDNLDKKILDLKKRDQYVRCTYGELLRVLLEKGLSEDAGDAEPTTTA